MPDFPKDTRVPLSALAEQTWLATGGYAQINRATYQGRAVAVKYALAMGQGTQASVIVRAPPRPYAPRCLTLR